MPPVEWTNWALWDQQWPHPLQLACSEGWFSVPPMFVSLKKSPMIKPVTAIEVRHFDSKKHSNCGMLERSSWKHLALQAGKGILQTFVCKFLTVVKVTTKQQSQFWSLHFLSKWQLLPLFLSTAVKNVLWWKFDMIVSVQWLDIQFAERVCHMLATPMFE